MAEPMVTFALADRARRLAGVRLVQEIGLADPLDFTRVRGGWELEITRPDVDRMEYLLEVEDANGRRMTVTDPGNPLRAGGAFGDKSVREFSGYRAPDWLGVEPVASTEVSSEIDAPELDGSVSVLLWTPDSLAAGEPAPLVVVHDGPEYARLGGFTHYLGAGIATGTLPPLRAALLDPGDRNAWYSADPAYAQALGEHVLPALEEAAPATTRVGVGVSLGGLAMLHAHRSLPGAFDALLLQSSSFFTAELDPQEVEFSGFANVSAFVKELADADADAAPVPTVLTCGTVEENLANNAAMTEHLRRLGYRAAFVRVRDAHNYTAWRDALDPHLAGLVSDAAAACAA